MSGKMYEKRPEEDARYHDTWRLLKKYRDVTWSLELSIRQVKNQFRIDYDCSIEDFLESIYMAGADLGGTDIENHARCIERSYKMLTLLENSVNLLRTHHQSGEVYYWILYYSFLSPQKLKNVEEIIEALHPHIRDIIVARTNALRAEHGIAALTADDQLMRAAQVRADEMAATGAYSHTRPDGRKYYTVTDCRQVGENIHQIPLLYLAQQKTALAETLVYSWSKSAGHMENMTDESYAAIGVGLARGTDANGLECWYCVQLFLRSGYSISAMDKPATK